LVFLASHFLSLVRTAKRRQRIDAQIVAKNGSEIALLNEVAAIIVPLNWSLGVAAIAADGRIGPRFIRFWASLSALLACPLLSPPLPLT
jgi:hypothetical protein